MSFGRKRDQLRVQPECCGFTNLSVAGLNNQCESPCKALLQFLESRSQFSVAGAIFHGSYGSTGSFVHAQDSG
jgi:hypothetical protein